MEKIKYRTQKKQMKLHAKEGDNEYLQNTNMKSYWYLNGKGKELKMLDFQLLSSYLLYLFWRFKHFLILTAHAGIWKCFL